MSATAKTPAATSARYWTKEEKPARKAIRRARRHADREVLAAIVKGTLDADAAIFTPDLGTEGRFSW